jgi:hypothetical protein
LSSSELYDWQIILLAGLHAKGFRIQKEQRVKMFNKNRQAISPGKKARGFAFNAMAVLMLSLMSIASVRATIPIPFGWTLHYSGLSLPGAPYQGVRVYKKTNGFGTVDYVTIVDMRYGTLRSFTGEVSGDKVYRYPISTYWSRGIAQNKTYQKAAVVINGAFFNPRDYPFTGIAFGLKSDWWIMSYGYGAKTEYQNPFLLRTFVYDSPYGSSSIQSYSRSTFGLGVPNVIGGLDVTADKNPSGVIPRTFVGVRDDNGDTKSETVIFFSSKAATQAIAANVLGSFGAGSKMMLDGGSSTGLVINGGKPLIETSGAAVPQAFVIYTGK